MKKIVNCAYFAICVRGAKLLGALRRATYQGGRFLAMVPVGVHHIVQTAVKRRPDRNGIETAIGRGTARSIQAAAGARRSLPRRYRRAGSGALRNSRL